MKLGQIYFKKLNKIAIITNFLEFFLFLFKNFPSWISILYADPDPGGKMNADPDAQLFPLCNTTLAPVHHSSFLCPTQIFPLSTISVAEPEPLTLDETDEILRLLKKQLLKKNLVRKKECWLLFYRSWNRSRSWSR